MVPQRILAILSLAVASVSAIDARFFQGNNCAQRTWVACNNINPGICCGTPDDSYSISGGFFAVPPSWSIVCQWWSQTGCSSGPLAKVGLSNGNADVCRTTSRENVRWLRGLSYYFNSRKREAEDRPTAGCLRANTLHLDDGSEYDLTDLSNATYIEILQSASDVTKHAEIAKIHAKRLVTLPQQ
ncbi:hypothetical protein VTL71DRAFT_7339 [Oculimacula yallundae]|uniref:Uncharacterized protein n=1 Tax=Oculimacula yallundae TaxID=86028 RepID=A0ABR4BWG8_9HELO